MQRVRKGDTVEVLSGDERGQRGQVHAVLPKESRVLVSGINLVKKHQRRTGNVKTQTGIIEFEAPVHLSNLAYADPKDGKPTKVGFKVKDDGSRVRVAKRSGAEIDG